MEQDPKLAHSILEQAADAVIFADGDGVIRFWNRAAVALFGFGAEEALGASLDLIVPEHLRRAHWVGFRRAIESGTTRLGGRATITRALHKSGKRLYVDMSFAVVRGPDGSVVGSVAIARDATARYEEEKARRQPAAVR
ncbi:PAS domain S-box protein [Pelomicrobium sp. G1]|uniref:PAS domain S-box protein n=1 Tax=unclassified Pelomicrobium TaxID=2815318 RepID=UPI0021DEA266|nr:MAG: signal transduction histidine kinase [Burkholderiales bacterium]